MKMWNLEQPTSYLGAAFLICKIKIMKYFKIRHSGLRNEVRCPGASEGEGVIRRMITRADVQS